MKTLLSIITVLSISAFTYAQTPETVNYQGIARDVSGNQLVSQAVGIRITILEGGVSGTNEYQEIHTVVTNQFGLFTLQIGNGTVQAGSFATIDWGTGTYFVQTEMDETGGSNYQMMGTSQLLSVPYALHAKTVENDQVDDADADPTNEMNSSMVLNGTDLELTDGNGTLTTDLSTLGGNTLGSAYNQGGPGAGATIVADAGPVVINTNSPNAIALDIDHTSTGVGTTVSSNNASNTFSAIQGYTNSGSAAASSIVGSTDGLAWGVSGQASAISTSAAAVYGSNLRTNGGHGVLGIGVNGVVGQTDYQTGFGVYGYNNDAIAPLGNAVGTYGYGYVGVWGDNNGTGGYSVYANGDLGASGTKTFSIDHPQDPENKYLRHFSIESNEVLNVYRGNAEFDANGEAIVTLPSYFTEVNKNFSYQLTPVGGYAPLFIKTKIENGQFIIGGGQAGLEVSWTVQAERNDPYMQQNPEKREVEPSKEDWNKGKYLMPELYGQDDDKKIVKPLPSTEQKELNLEKEN